ncbi:MAG: hypothetical protein FWJ66_13105 [Caldibacillus sp.]
MIEKTWELLKNEGFTITKNVTGTSIYILPNGYAIDGDYVYGDRTREHREIEAVLSIDRYHPDFWNQIFHRLHLVLVEPETQIYMYPREMNLTAEQLQAIDWLQVCGYEYMEFK